MKRILLVGAFVLAVLFVSLPHAQATCYPTNESTGVCDVGGECTTKPGVCCPNQSECASTNLGQGTSNNVSSGIFCGTDGKSINTALGCISVTGTGFVTTLLNFGIGIAGGIAMLLIIFGGFQILTSAGNPERLNEGKELISSAITGLLMIIFSVFLLRIIGINILGIPSFS